MDDVLPTHLLVSAQIRTAAAQGIPITLIHKGDADNGTVLLKINRLDGTALLLRQAWMDEERVWVPLGNTNMPDKEADAMMLEERSFDPDLWLVEIEDRAGRLWFPGRILETL